MDLVRLVLGTLGDKRARLLGIKRVECGVGGWPGCLSVGCKDAGDFRASGSLHALKLGLKKRARKSEK